MTVATGKKITFFGDLGSYFYLVSALLLLPGYTHGVAMAYIAGAPNPSPKKVRRSKVLAKIAKGECPKMCACGH